MGVMPNDDNHATPAPAANMAPETALDAHDVAHFAAQVAHDLNNLLTGILGNLELMQNRAKRTGITNFDTYLEGARNAGTRAASFARRLLAFSGQVSQEPAPLEITAALLEAADILQAPVTTEPADEPLYLFCDGGQFTLTIVELLQNATAAGATAITLASGRLGSHIIITVQDNGTGMSHDTLARCKQPFFSTQPNGTGRGLGLAIANRFATSLGGDLLITSQPGDGTIARLALPRFISA
jgi:signal transduction histidine kinase